MGGVGRTKSFSDRGAQIRDACVLGRQLKPNAMMRVLGEFDKKGTNFQVKNLPVDRHRALKRALGHSFCSVEVICEMCRISLIYYYNFSTVSRNLSHPSFLYVNDSDANRLHPAPEAIKGFTSSTFYHCQVGIGLQEISFNKHRTSPTPRRPCFTQATYQCPKHQHLRHRFISFPSRKMPTCNHHSCPLRDLEC